MQTAAEILGRIVERALTAAHPATASDTCADPLCPKHNREELERLAEAVSTAAFPSRPDFARRDVASLIDHTLLRPEATITDIERLCAEAARHRFAAVCVNPAYVLLCRTLLAGSGVAVATVAGFPLGANATLIKTAEASHALKDGAAEIDMVMNVGMLKSGQYRYVEDDVRAVADTTRTRKALCKVILETCLLTDEDKVRACLLARRAGADFVKTSTGFSTSGATAADVALMRLCVGHGMGVKAAGGIKSFADAVAMIGAGANRIGSSAGVSIVSEAG